MGLLDIFTGSKAPTPGVTRLSAVDLRAALLALDRDTAPWQVRDGAPDGCDLVAEWKIVDARWYEIFAKASLSKVFRVLMKIDEARGEMRALDQEFTVEWRAGIPTLSASVETFRGQKVELSFGNAVGFREDLGLGKIYEYRFSTKELKEPLQQTVTGAGWRWTGVTFGKL